VYLESIGPGRDYVLDCDGNGNPCFDHIPGSLRDGYYEAYCRSRGAQLTAATAANCTKSR
jgi:hypothetical protein